MTIDRETVTSIARLSRLNIEQQDMTPLIEQFNDILHYMNDLAKADTTHVAPLYSPLEEQALMREDRLAGERSKGEVLEHAPDTDGNYFIVPKII